MQTYTEAIVKKVPKTIASALTTADLGSPDYEKACEQHERYVGALRDCGIEITVLEADDKFPDSVFIEDTAVVTDRCAIITNPGEETRRGEVHDTAGVLSERYGNVEFIRSPGTLDGGDVLQVGDHFYIGLTQRTNPEGAEQLADVLRNHDFDATFVSVRKFLHLKTGIAYLSNNDLLVAGELADHATFEPFDKIVVTPEEEYCANCIRVNDHVLVPEGCDRTTAEIVERGYEVIELGMSEFEKLDGGLSCLSLRLQ